MEQKNAALEKTQHSGYITPTFTDDQYEAGCNCGWRGTPVDTEQEASRQLQQHTISSTLE